MNDGWLFVITTILSLAAAFDWYVAAKFIGAAIERPHIPILNLAALRSIAIAVATTIFGVLGIVSVVFAVYGVRILPVPIPTVLLVTGAIVISLPNLYFLRVLGNGDEL